MKLNHSIQYKNSPYLSLGGIALIYLICWDGTTVYVCLYDMSYYFDVCVDHVLCWDHIPLIAQLGKLETVETETGNGKWKQLKLDANEC